MIHVLQFGTGNRRITCGHYEGQPCLIIEGSNEGHAPGTFGITPPEQRNTIADGATVLRFGLPESAAVFRDMADDLVKMIGADPVMPRLTEGAHFVIEAATQYGFIDQGDTLLCTETQLVNFIDAAREQGRKDAEAARGR